jgi:hypothetical protein
MPKQKYVDYVVVKDANIATMDHYDKAGYSLDEFEYHGEGAYMFFTDLPRSGFSKLYSVAETLVESVNNNMWQLDIDSWQQPLRFNTYTKGGSFPLHTDHDRNDASKLALVQLMNDDFVGGELQIVEDVIDLSPGDAVVFPAFIPHSVAPVLSGERITFTGWVSGPRFV